MANVIVCNGGSGGTNGFGCGSGRKRRPSYLSDDVMDDCMAAMVLMSLSCSPKSPRLPHSIQTDYRRIVYRCTWPGCGQQCDHCHQIEKHVRTHIGRTDVNGESSDHEEEFYYTEIEMDDSVSSGSSSDSNSGSNSNSSHSPHAPHSPVPQSPSASNDGSTMSGSGSQSPIPSHSPPLSFFASSSAPTWSHLEDHEYQKPYEELELVSKRNININMSSNSNSMTNGVYKQNQKSLLSNPINIPGISFAHQYAKSAPSVALHSPRANNKYMRLNSNNKSGTTILQSPSKNSPKRGRGESRKCRKVYGMDNRDQWCTQCKWKKACSRFTD